MNKLHRGLLFPILVLVCGFAHAQSAPTLLNEPLDISADFRDWANYYYFADSLASFDPATGKGTLKWNKQEATPGHAFSNTQFAYERSGTNTFPSAEYQTDPVLPFSLEFVSPKTVRLRAWRYIKKDVLGTHYYDCAKQFLPRKIGTQNRNKGKFYLLNCEYICLHLIFVTPRLFSVISPQNIRLSLPKGLKIHFS
jgi:hypothetical protein